MAPDIQPPSAMPSSVIIITKPTRPPAWLAGKFSRIDDRVARHQAALEQAEQRRDHVQRRQPVASSDTATAPSSAPTEPISSVARPPSRSAMKPGADAADDAEAQHQRQHLRARARCRSPGRRNRRRCAPAASTSPRSRQGRRPPAAICSVRGGSAIAAETAMAEAALPAARCGERPRSSSASGTIDAKAEQRRSPGARLRQPMRPDHVLDERRPDRAGDVVAGGAQRHRDAAPPLEPERDVGHQRHEGRGACRTCRSASRRPAANCHRPPDIDAST